MLDSVLFGSTNTGAVCSRGKDRIMSVRETDELRQRHLKLLYRLRGSASRTIDYDVVIEQEQEQQQRQQQQEPELEPELEPVYEQEQDEMPELGDDAADLGNFQADEYGSDDHVMLPEQPVEVDLTQFEHMTLPQLSTPLTSMATIDVLRRLLETVLQSTIEDRVSQFRRAGSARLKLKLKLEIKILQRFLEQCVQDLSTLSDLNLSNNDLVYRLKQISLLKNSLSQSLLQVRSSATTYEEPQLAVAQDQVVLDNFKRINELIMLQRNPGGESSNRNLPPDTAKIDPNSKSGLLSELRKLNEGIQNITN